MHFILTQIEQFGYFIFDLSIFNPQRAQIKGIERARAIHLDNFSLKWLNSNLKCSSRSIWILIFLLLISFFNSSLSAQAPNESALFVELSTKQQMLPLFAARFADDNSGYPPEYIASIEKILEFDLTHSGYFQMLSHTSDRDYLAGSTGLHDRMKWKALNALYVVKGCVYPQKFSMSVLLVTENQLKKVEIPLTGILNQDRKQLHQLSDSIVQMITGNPGIASSRILYTHKYRNKNLNQWVSEVWESDYDGFNNRKIIGQECGYCVTPIYIPPKSGYQSSAYFYVSYKNGQPKIYLGSLSGGQGWRLANLRGNQLMPAISRQRDKIAFINDITGNPDLFLQDFSAEQGPIGKPRQIFTTHQATQGSPTFSPDGQHIAFVSNKDGSPRIYVMAIPSPETKLKDIKARLITHTNRESSAPSWSPDGKKLAYCARNPNGTRQIWIYDFDRDEEWQLTQGPENKENPSWAPNSLHLVYNTTGNQGADLFIINLNNSNPIKIYNPLPGERRFPAWGVSDSQR